MIPVWEEGLQHLSQWPQSGTLRLYGQPSERVSVVYEDDGDGLDYQQGKYLWRSFQAESQADSIDLLETRQGQGEVRTHYQLQHDWG